MSWLVLAVLSAVFLGLYDVAKKASLDDNAVLSMLFACSLSGAALVLPAGILSWTSPELAGRLGLFIATLDPRAHLLVLAKAGIVTLSWVLTFFAIKHLPISLASPVRASGPLFVVLGAVALFGERLSFEQWLGVAAILGAYWAFSVIGRAEGIHFEKNRWVWMLLAGTAVGAASGLYDKHLLQSAHLPPLAMQFWFTLYNAALQGLIALIAGKARSEGAARFHFRWSIVAVGALLLLADNLYFRSLAIPGALVSVVSTVRRTNVIISFSVGSIAFRERFRRRKAMALAGVLAGLLLLTR